jgi:hypothetical protein
MLEFNSQELNSMNTKFLIVSLLLMASFSHASKDITELVPECSVIDEPDCREVSEFIGPQMDCMKSAIKRKKICDQKTQILIEEAEAELH